MTDAPKAEETPEAEKVPTLKAETVIVKKEQSKKIEDQSEAVQRVQKAAQAQGYKTVSLKQDHGDSWEFVFYP